MVFSEDVVDLFEIFNVSGTLEECRKKVFLKLCEMEMEVSGSETSVLSFGNRSICLEAIRITRNMITRRSEKLSGHSVLGLFRNIATRRVPLADCEPSFVEEARHLLSAIKGQLPTQPFFFDEDAIQGYERPGQSRSDFLDNLGEYAERFMSKYPTGLDPEVIAIRSRNAEKIFHILDPEGKGDWNDWQWHLKHSISDLPTLRKLITLPEEMNKSLECAIASGISWGISPYYLSLFEGTDGRQMRAQVLPSTYYTEAVSEIDSDTRHSVLDFMREKDTTPIEMVGRRYPLVCTLKPTKKCAQICVYCQRNWEIEDVPDTVEGIKGKEKDSLAAALDWIKDHDHIQEVLVTGGDPITLSDCVIDSIIRSIESIPHVRRIRIGTRTLVVLPQRWTQELVNILARYRKPGIREVAVVTHFESVQEISPDTVAAVNRIRQAGISVYNQHVFSIETCRRFEASKLRQCLRSIGVDPYYTFNMKGKPETRDMMVPIARLLQEQKEESRLLPGLDRTDEAVFNMPVVGKCHLRSGQDRNLISILPNGSRVYEFHSWDKMLVENKKASYIYTDVSIFDFLQTLKKRGEKPDDYESIWYYY